MRAAKTLALICLTCWGCSPSGEALFQERLNGRAWYGQDTLWGGLVIERPDACRDLELEIALEADYPWQNLYLMSWVEQPDGYRQESRLELVFMDSLGRWYAANRHFRRFIARGLRFGMAGTYRIGLAPYVRPDSVTGVRLIRLRAYPCP